MNIKARIASVYIPHFEKNKKYFQLLMEYLLATYDTLNENYEKETAKFLLSTISSRAGTQVARMLKNELSMPCNYESAILSWEIGCVLLGIKIQKVAHKEGILFYHNYDPLWNCFKKKSLDLCEQVCIPMVNSVAQGFCPQCSAYFERPPTLELPCIKLLKKG